MDLRASLNTLFSETFEGIAPEANETYYVQGKEACFPLLAALSAEPAWPLHPVLEG